MDILKIRTEQFEGPLDLMLFLIQKNELDISTVSIHKITDQYLQYCELIKDLNFDSASEFLVMAATLIHLKSKRLLPQDDLNQNKIDTNENEILSEEQLVQRLLEYQKFQKAAQTIQKLPQKNVDVFTRPNVPPPEKQTVWKELDLTELTVVFQTILKKSRKRQKVIIREPTSIPEKIMELAKILKVGKLVEFEKLFENQPNRSQIIVTFIALLEIARLKKVRLYQNEVFGTIYVNLIESLDDFNVELATGFNYNSNPLKELQANATN